MSLKERFLKIFLPVDLTKGNVTKSIIIFSIPILLSLVFQQIYSITDAAIAGQNLSANEIAGISDVGCLTYIILDFGFGCTSGFSAVTAKAFGAKKYDDVKKSYSIQIVLTFIIGIVLTIVALLCVDLLLGCINIKKGNPVYEYGYTYIFIFFCGTISQLFYNLFSNALRSIGDSTTPLLFLICSVILNIILDVLFIIVFHWGVVGVAVATIITQTISAIACFIYANKRYEVFKISIKDLNIDWKYAFEHIKNGVPLGLQFSVLAFGIIVMQGAVVNFDIASNDPTQPAQLGYGAVNKLIGALMCVPNGIGTAMLSFTGQNYGAKQYARVREGIKKSTIITIISSLIISVISLLLCINGAFLYIFLSPNNINAQTIKYGTYYFYANMPLFFTLGLLFVGRNTLQGIEKPTFPFIAGIIELVVRVLISLYIPSLVNPSNPTSDISYFFLMSADVISWIFASALLYAGLIKNVYRNPVYKIEKNK